MRGNLLGAGRWDDMSHGAGEAQPLLLPSPDGASDTGHPTLEATWLGGSHDPLGKGKGEGAEGGREYTGGDAGAPEATFGLPPGIRGRVFLERRPAGPHAWPACVAPAHPGLDAACEPLRPLFRGRGALLIGDCRGFVALPLLAAAAAWTAEDGLPLAFLNFKAISLLPVFICLPFVAALIAVVYLSCVATRWTCDVERAVEEQLGPALNDALRTAGLGHLQARVKFNYKFAADDWATYKRRRGLTFESEPQCFCSYQRLPPPEGAKQEGTVWSTFWLWVDFVETAAALGGPSVPPGPMSRGRGVTFVGGSSRWGTFTEVG